MASRSDHLSEVYKTTTIHHLFKLVNSGHYAQTAAKSFLVYLIYVLTNNILQMMSRFKQSIVKTNAGLKPDLHLLSIR